MANRRPLVLVSGSEAELPAADAITGTFAGSFAGTWVADDSPVWTAGGFVPKQHSTLEVATAFAVPATTLGDITGLTIALSRAGTFFFEFVLLVSQATAVSTFGCAVNFTGTVTRLAVGGVLWNAATAPVVRAQTANNTAMLFNATQAAASGPFESAIRGSITTSTAGTLSCRAQRSAATTTIAAGSSGFVREK